MTRSEAFIIEIKVAKAEQSVKEKLIKYKKVFRR